MFLGNRSKVGKVIMGILFLVTFSYYDALFFGVISLFVHRNTYSVFVILCVIAPILAGGALSALPIYKMRTTSL